MEVGDLEVVLGVDDVDWGLDGLKECELKEIVSAMRGTLTGKFDLESKSCLMNFVRKSGDTSEGLKHV